jgi:VanZ family protein
MKAPGILRANNPWLDVVLWMAFIFVLSSDLGSATHTSMIIEPLVLWLRPNASPEEIARVHFFVRKAGHLSEYAVLALLLFRTIRRAPFPSSSAWSWKNAGLALFIAAAYAASDEWHQSFVASRTADFHDVLIDSGGALVGLTVLFLWYKITSWRSIFRTKAPARD